MPRPKKCRRICALPRCSRFGPLDGAAESQVALALEELEDCRVLSAWSYEVTGSQSDTVTIRLRSDGAENPGAAVWEDGIWRRADATLDGSYLVFSGPVQGKVVLLDEGASHIWIWALGLGAAVLLGAGGAVVRRHRTSKEASPGEGEEKRTARR